MTSIRHNPAGQFLSTPNTPTVTGDWTYCMWVKINSGGYGGASDTAMFGVGTTGASSDGIVLAVPAATNTVLQAQVFRSGGSELQTVNLLTGSDTGWMCFAARHTSGSLNYDISSRRENVTTWSTTTLSLTAALQTPTDLRIGSDQFGENFVDGNSRHFFAQAARLTDAQLLTASQNINQAPAGTNLHWLILTTVGTAGTNGGTAANWTVTGTLTSQATEPTEVLSVSEYSRVTTNFRLANTRIKW